MRAARLSPPGTLVCETVATPRLGDVAGGEVLVRTELAALCGSDLHVVRHGLGAPPPPGPPGFPGHEGVGDVLDSVDGRFAPGQRVLTVPRPATAATFADVQLLEADAVVPLPADLEFERALLAQQLGTVLFALQRFWPAAGAPTVAIVGAGSAGLLFLQEVRRRGADVVVVSDLEPSRRRRALALGADVAVDPRERSATAATMDATAGTGAALVVEAAGHDDARADAVGCLAVGGTLGLFGLPERSGDAVLPFETMFRRRATVHMEHGAQEEPGRSSFRLALRQIVEGVTDVTGMLTHTYPIERIGEALDHAADRRDDVCKIAVTFRVP